MAVYKRTYTRYTGPRTNEQWRFSVLPRFALKSVFDTKINTTLFSGGLLIHVAAIGVIYLVNNFEALSTLNLPFLAPLRFIVIDESFFMNILTVETYISFFLVALVGPGLVSPDLANNALPVYLSRPFSRAEYVFGKMSVLLLVTSLITWLPGLLLVGVQVSLAGPSWLSENGRVVPGLLLSSWIWISTISLIALALSAWVKWKPVAAVSLFGVFFLAAAFGRAANEMLSVRWGLLLNMPSTMRMLMRWFFLGESAYQIQWGDPVLSAWSGLVTMVGICGFALFMLGKKVRATQVVK
jgi:ABC-2 type transport system permease protein